MAARGALREMCRSRDRLACLPDKFEIIADPRKESQVRNASPRRSLRTKPARASPAHPSSRSPLPLRSTASREAARFYVLLFKGEDHARTRNAAVGQECIGRPWVGLNGATCLNGLPFLGLNGGPNFKFNEAVSLMILCDTQAEVDSYWDKLSAGGDPNAQACGWLKDRFGLSWQVVPKGVIKLWKDHKSAATERAFAAMMDMKKLDIAKLKAAHKGK